MQYNKIQKTIKVECCKNSSSFLYKLPLLRNLMKTALTIFFTFMLTSLYGQTKDYKVFLDSAKTLFKSSKNLNKEELYQFDYYQVVSLLEKVIELDPKNSEARYFLGYTYSRINSRDGRSIIDMNLKLLYKTSEQFEKVIELTPKYTDEIIILDPYSKLTSEWGSMAMKYSYLNKPDSAIWAFTEGKKRGGFGKFILEFNRTVLNKCSKNSILLSDGDNSIFPLLYLQKIENFRTDITIIEINLLNTIWYTNFLSNNELISFNISNDMLDTIDAIKWEDTTITINNFSWVVKSRKNSKYLLRGDRVFLSLLKKNKFSRELNFQKIPN